MLRIHIHWIRIQPKIVVNCRKAFYKVYSTWGECWPAHQEGEKSSQWWIEEKPSIQCTLPGVNVSQPTRRKRRAASSELEESLLYSVLYLGWRLSSQPEGREEQPVVNCRKAYYSVQYSTWGEGWPAHQEGEKSSQWWTGGKPSIQCTGYSTWGEGWLAHQEGEKSSQWWTGGKPFVPHCSDQPARSQT